MSQVTDIGSLYEHKYLSAIPHQATPYISNHNFTSLQRFHFLSQRMQRPHSRNNIKCIKIVTTPDIRTSQQPTKIVQCPKKHIKQSHPPTRRQNLRNSQSMYLPSRNSQLLRQLMRVSHQEMGELQQSAGGQKKLKNLFEQFFKERNKSKQKKKQRYDCRQFVSVYSATDQVKRPSYRQLVHQKKESKKEMQSVRGPQEKQIAPWNIQLEGDFS